MKSIRDLRNARAVFFVSGRLALFGGNCNNGLQCGPFYVNLNNTASNANWNIGARHSYPITVRMFRKFRGSCQK
jgi:hypothetical protein